MSWYVNATIVNTETKQILTRGGLNEIKSLSDRGYAIALEDISSTATSKLEEYPEIEKWYVREYVDSYRNEAMGIDGFKEKIKSFKAPDTREDSYIIEETDFEAFKEKLEPYKLSTKDLFDLMPKNEEDRQYFNLNIRKLESVKGCWYRFSDFENALSKYEERYEKSLKRFWKLKDMKDTPQYFEMSNDARDRYCEELGYAEEELEYNKTRCDAVKSVVSILSFFGDGNLVEYYEDEYGLSHSRHNGGEVEVFLEIV